MLWYLFFFRLRYLRNMMKLPHLLCSVLRKSNGRSTFLACEKFSNYLKSRDAYQSKIFDSGQNSRRMPYLARKGSEMYTQVRNFEKNAMKLLKIRRLRRANNPFTVKKIWMSDIHYQNWNEINQLLNFLPEKLTRVRKGECVL